MTELKNIEIGPKSIQETEEMINVGMNTWGITKSDHKYPILKTKGLGPCVGVALYDPDKKVAGLVHIVEPRYEPKWQEVCQDIVNTVTPMEKLGANRKTLEVSIIGGYPNDKLPELVKNVITVSLGIEKIIKDIRTKNLNTGMSIAIDSKTGNLINLIINSQIEDTPDKTSFFKKSALGANKTSDKKSLG